MPSKKERKGQWRKTSCLSMARRTREGAMIAVGAGIQHSSPLWPMESLLHSCLSLAP